MSLLFRECKTAPDQDSNGTDIPLENGEFEISAQQIAQHFGPQLSELIALWPNVPPADRKKILAIAQASAEPHSP